MKPCPKCHKETEILEEDGATYAVCKHCGYDEREAYDEAYPEQRGTQREKGKHSPYKQGGHGRTQAKT